MRRKKPMNENIGINTTYMCPSDIIITVGRTLYEWTEWKMEKAMNGHVSRISENRIISKMKENYRAIFWGHGATLRINKLET